MDTVVIDKTDAITGHFIRESHGHFNETKVGGKLSVEFRVINIRPMQNGFVVSYVI
jgi:hypothetical protein